MVLRYLLGPMPGWFTPLFAFKSRSICILPLADHEIVQQITLFLYGLYVRDFSELWFLPIILLFRQMHMKPSRALPDKLQQVIQRKSHIWTYWMKTHRISSCRHTYDSSLKGNWYEKSLMREGGWTYTFSVLAKFKVCLRKFFIRKDRKMKSVWLLSSLFHKSGNFKKKRCAFLAVQSFATADTLSGRK